MMFFKSSFIASVCITKVFGSAEHPSLKGSLTSAGTHSTMRLIKGFEDFPSNLAPRADVLGATERGVPQDSLTALRLQGLLSLTTEGGVPENTPPAHPLVANATSHAGSATPPDGSDQPQGGNGTVIVPPAEDPEPSPIHDEKVEPSSSDSSELPLEHMEPVAVIQCLKQIKPDEDLLCYKSNDYMCDDSDEEYEHQKTQLDHLSNFKRGTILKVHDTNFYALVVDRHDRCGDEKDYTVELRPIVYHDDELPRTLLRHLRRTSDASKLDHVQEKLLQQYHQKRVNDGKKRIRRNRPCNWDWKTLTNKVETLIIELLGASFPPEGKYAVIERICEWYEKGNKNIKFPMKMRKARCEKNFETFIDVALQKYRGTTSYPADGRIKTDMTNDLRQVLKNVDTSGSAKKGGCCSTGVK